MRRKFRIFITSIIEHNIGLSVTIPVVVIAHITDVLSRRGISQGIDRHKIMCIVVIMDNRIAGSHCKSFTSIPLHVIEGIGGRKAEGVHQLVVADT